MTTYETKIKAKQESCRDAIPPAWRVPQTVLRALKTPLQNNANNIIESQLVERSAILSEQELKITNDYDVEQLVAALASGMLSAMDVTIAFSKRAAVAHQLVNCLTETYFEEAIERAKFLDELRAKGQVCGPLHGLPVSLKDSFQVAGSDATLGVVSYLDQASESNSPLVDILLMLGAVVYVKTNVPQTLATVDTDNNIFGRTFNPWNTKLGAGGSSGGEGALVALRGSPLGVGTDVGGSIRIPALCCGIYGFKPTASRIPYAGQKDCSEPGISAILACAGPLGHDIASLQFFMKTVLDIEPARFDSSVINVPWRSVPRNPNAILRIGLLPEDPRFPLHPPVKRAMSEAIHKLQAAGHCVLTMDHVDCHISDATETAWKMFMIDDTAYKLVQAGEESLVPSVVYTHNLARGLQPKSIPDLSGLDRLSQLAVLSTKRANIADDWRRTWISNNLDCVISPSAQSTAVEHDKFGLPPYTTLTNILDYPSCIIPFGHAEPDSTSAAFEIRPGQIAPPYVPEDVKGAPTSVQIFTQSMKDEECLIIAGIVDTCLKKSM